MHLPTVIMTARTRPMHVKPDKTPAPCGSRHEAPPPAKVILVIGSCLGDGGSIVLYSTTLVGGTHLRTAPPTPRALELHKLDLLAFT